MKSILFVNHLGKQCGVYQYGYRFFKTLESIPNYRTEYIECGNAQIFLEKVQKMEPDAIIYNYHPATLPFIVPELFRPFKKQIHICLAHELSQKMADEMDGVDFNFYLYGDPTLKARSPLVFSLGRLLPNYKPSQARKAIENPIIGSYGFAGDLKGFDRLLKMVENEFDSATIRLNIPPNTVVDLDDKIRKSVILRCKTALRNPNIKLEISEKFFTEEELLNFLESNDLNVFPYLDKEKRFHGIASATDFALAVNRPIAISDCHMFRHLWGIQPSIVAPMSGRALRLRKFLNLQQVKQWKKRYYNYRSLKEILQQGSEPLRDIREQWSVSAFTENLSDTLSQIFSSKEKSSSSCHANGDTK